MVRLSEIIPLIDEDVIRVIDEDGYFISNIKDPRVREIYKNDIVQTIEVKNGKIVLRLHFYHPTAPDMNQEWVKQNGKEPSFF